MNRCTTALISAVLTTALFPAAVQADASQYGLETVSGSLSTHQAGGHPDFTTTIKLKLDSEGHPFARTRDVIVDLPPGLVGNPSVVEECTAAQFQSSLNGGGCPQDSQIGITDVEVLGLAGGFREPVFLLQPTKPNAVARLGFFAGLYPTYVDAELRTDGPAPDYGVSAKAEGLSAQGTLLEATTTIWGVPAAESHDTLRLTAEEAKEGTKEVPPRASGLTPKPFLINPGSCGGPIQVEVHADSYSLPGLFSSLAGSLGSIEGCETLVFAPTLKARPTTDAADSPSGLDVDVHIPQQVLEDPTENAPATLRDATVTLPEGLVVNPAGANGLDACSPEQVGLSSTPGTEPISFTRAPARCPDASKIGTVEIDTPLLDHPVPGAVYVASPRRNPFDSLLAIYIVIDDPQSNLVLKLAGKVSPDSTTGQLTTRLHDIPQLIFEDSKLHLFGGPRAALRTQPLCGGYATTSSLNPWSAPQTGPPATPSDAYSIDRGAGGSGCPTSLAAQPHAPVFDGGTISSRAGAYSPMVVDLSRQDGSQEFGSLTVTPPPGLLARLTGVPYCPETALLAAAAKSGNREKATSSCPAASQVGSVTVGAGAGPAPYYATGKAYLAGPYKGAPLSLAIVTPATAGPYDLGTVVVRTALYLDPVTARITAVSDAIPRILQGIPLDVRSISISIDRPRFTLNPTNCEPLSLSGTAVSVLGQVASLANRFQASACRHLPFKPRLDLALEGGARRGAHPALRATLRMPTRTANVAFAQVALPHSEFLEQAHIRTICTRVQFAAGDCPAGSIYGHARAITPLLDKPLDGPVYLRSSSHRLPDLVAALRGQVSLNLVGRIDSVKGGIRSTFEAVPDAPVSKFTLFMRGGKRGLVVNSRDLCTEGDPHATVKFRGQNGKPVTKKLPLGTDCARGKRNKH